MGKARADVRDSQAAHQKFGKLKYHGTDAGKFFAQASVPLRQFRVKAAYHGCARTGRTNHRFRCGKDTDETARQRERILPITGAERRLAAARLLFGKINLATDAFEHFGHGPANLRNKLIHETRNKKRDFGRCRHGRSETDFPQAGSQARKCLPRAKPGCIPSHFRAWGTPIVHPSRSAQGTTKQFSGHPPCITP